MILKLHTAEHFQVIGYCKAVAIIFHCFEYPQFAQYPIILLAYGNKMDMKQKTNRAAFCFSVNPSHPTSIMAE